MSLPKNIYHYCNVETFMKITENKNLWLSNSFKMNDAYENTWIEQFINDKINSLDDKYEKFINQFISLYKFHNNVPYLACFSEKGDILSQWRAYADDGSGIAIAFNTEQLGLKEYLPGLGVDADITTGLYNVLYDDKKQAKIVNNIFDNFIAQIEKEELNESTASSLCADLLNRYSVVFKNPKFSEEKEWRIIHNPLITNDKNNNIEISGNISNMSFRPKDSGIISYFKFPLDDIFSSHLIPKIILGPKCELDKYDFQMYLNLNNLKNTKVVRSMASYR